jgi:ubiquinone/menaquinone biosynthesis C-methylase UbiE
MVPLEHLHLGDLRGWLLPQAAGRVLEVGAGTGASLSYYDYRRVDSLTLIDVDLRPALSHRASEIEAPSEVRELSVESLLFADGTFDTTVSNLVFCSVEDPTQGLRELFRVLKPGGRHLFMEHVRPADPIRGPLFDALTPAWRRIAGGCHLNRNTVSLIEAAGLTVRVLRDAARGIFVAGVADKSGPAR